MANLFHQLEAEDCMRLLPVAMEELAKQEDKVVLEALAQARTKKELKMAWSLVVASRLKGSPESAVLLAIKAPPLADLGSHFAKDAVSNYGVEALGNLLAKGMPFAWAARGLQEADISGALPVFDALDKSLGGKWSAKQALQFLSHLPKSATDTRQVMERLMSSEGYKLATRSDYRVAAKSLISGNPEHLGEFLSLLPEGYLKRTMVNAAAEASPDKEALAAANISPESTSGIIAPVQQSAMMKVIKTRDGGQEALRWALEISDVTERDAALRTVLAEAGKLYGPLQPLKLIGSTNGAGNTEEVMDEAVGRTLAQLGGRELTPAEIVELRNLNHEQEGALGAAFARAQATGILEKLK